MSARPSWARLRLLAGALILAAVIWRAGAGPVLHGLHRISLGLVLAAAVITLITTVASAWRWQLIATGLGAELSLTDAIRAYYRSQFLNTVLPGGVLGDVHRALDHGQRAGSLGRAARAVGWERGIGQVVQAILTMLILLVVGWPSRPVVLLTATVAAAVLLAVLAMLRRRWPDTVEPDLRAISRRASKSAAASTVVVCGHVLVLMLAARSVGVSLAPARLIALCLLVLLATSIPLNVAGWGPREGAAAWLFGLAGSSSAVGLSAATVDGILVLLACLPGALVLLTSTSRETPKIMVGAHG